MQITKLETDALFTQYMHVVNRAIENNRDKFPFQQLLSMGEKMIGGKNIGVAIYKTDPKQPHDYFTLRFTGAKLTAEHGKQGPDISWRVKEEHLQHVVENPEHFVDNPALLDLDWLVTRLGLHVS